MCREHLAGSISSWVRVGVRRRLCLKGQPREASCPLDPSPRPLCASFLRILTLISCPSLSVDYGRCQMPHVAPDIDCHRRLLTIACPRSVYIMSNFPSIIHQHIFLWSSRREGLPILLIGCATQHSAAPHPLYVREKQIEAERSLLLFSSFIKKRKGWGDNSLGKVFASKHEDSSSNPQIHIKSQI